MENDGQTAATSSTTDHVMHSTALRKAKAGADLSAVVEDDGPQADCGDKQNSETDAQRQPKGDITAALRLRLHICAHATLNGEYDDIRKLYIAGATAAL